jgi:membrane protease YdiL (CAAX protease family)
MIGSPDNSPKTRLRLLRELSFVLTVTGAVYALGFVLQSPGLGLLSIVTAWALISWRLRCRNSRWHIFGWHRPKNWNRTLVLVFSGVLVLHGLIRLLKPWITELTGQPLDISLFQGLRGDFAALVGGLFIVWTVAAFGEEMVFRGYVLNRMAQQFRSRKTGWFVGVLASSLFFGIGHVYQGWTGVILAALAGGVYCAAYFLDRRCLWAPILIHGVYDTTAFLILFLS